MARMKSRIGALLVGFVLERRWVGRRERRFASHTDCSRAHTRRAQQETRLFGELAAGAMNNCSSTSIVQRDALRNPRQWQTLPPYPQRSKDVQMLRKLRPPNIAGLAVSMLTLPLQASAHRTRRALGPRPVYPRAQSRRITSAVPPRLPIVQAVASLFLPPSPSPALRVASANCPACDSARPRMNAFYRNAVRGSSVSRISAIFMEEMSDENVTFAGR